MTLVHAGPEKNTSNVTDALVSCRETFVRVEGKKIAVTKPFPTGFAQVFKAATIPVRRVPASKLCYSFALPPGSECKQ